MTPRAQTRQGVVVYERRVDFYRHLQDEQMKAMVPQFQTARYEVIFKDTISVYKIVPKDEAPDPFDAGGGGMVIKFSGPGDDGVLYKNFGSGRLLQAATLDDQSYVIADSLVTIPWKLTDETRTILNHVCKKATATSARGAIAAWYALDMPVPAGPDRFGGLPGVILLVDVDNGGVVFSAVQIQPSVNTRDLAPSLTGKRVTRAEFTKKMDEVLGPADSLGRRMIRREG